MVYYIENIMDIPEGDFEMLYSMLPQKRQAVARRYRFEQDKRNSIMAFILLMFGLHEEFGIDGEFSIIRDTNGKPMLEEEGIWFNLSHCKKGVVCAVSTRKIGVDIQEIIDPSGGLEKSVLTQKEIEEYKSLNSDLERRERFTRLWALKESFVKYDGRGLSYGLQKLDFTGMEGNQFQKDGCSYFIRRIENGFLAVCAEETIGFKKMLYGEIMNFIYNKTSKL